MKTSVLTIRLDLDLERQLDDVARRVRVRTVEAWMDSLL
jgi:hypothetical protein